MYLMAGRLMRLPDLSQHCVAVGDDFDNGASKTHEAFAAEYVPGFAYAAVNGKYFQVIYVDAAGKIRGTGNVEIATSIT